MDNTQKFKNGVCRVRDVLRSVAITGMDSMRHICIYLLARHMTRENVAVFDIPEEFAWETVMDELRNKDGGMQHAYDRMYCNAAGKDSLVTHFDRLFETQKFSFDITDLHKHREILEILDGIDIQVVDAEMDLLGWVYEQHLKTGTSSVSRDLGQYFTVRTICAYMVKLCQPGLREDGAPESVCDPTMGTGGFLTSYIRYFKEHHPSVKHWAERVYGCDQDPRVAAIARLNVFLETKGTVPTQLLTHDSLYKDLPVTQYDNILANMPFGLKGLVFDSCCSRIRDLNIKGNKSEPLFLQLMMLSLAPGGRCAVVVPDGMISNVSACHKATRRYLLDHFELRKVVRLQGKLFMNTTAPIFILFFVNTGQSTTSIDFLEVEKTKDDILVERELCTVPVASLDANVSLDPRRYLRKQEEVISSSSSRYEKVRLGDVADILGGKGNYEKDGDTYPYYDSNGVTGRRNDFLYEGEFVVTARKLSIGSVHYVSGKFWPSDNTLSLRVTDPRVSPRFLYYWLKINNHVLKDLASGVKPGIRQSDVADIMMPLPSRAIQEEMITSIMECEEMQAIQAAAMNSDFVGRMMKTMSRSIDRRGFPSHAISEVMHVVGGKSNMDRDDDAYTVPYYDSNGITGRVASPLYTGQYTITARMLSIGAVHYVDGPFYPSDATICFTSRDDTNIMRNRFFYFWLHTNNHLLKDMMSGVKPHVRKSEVADLKMPVPPIAFQDEILRRLDGMNEWEERRRMLTSLQKQTTDMLHFLMPV